MRGDIGRFIRARPVIRRTGKNGYVVANRQLDYAIPPAPGGPFDGAAPGVPQRYKIRRPWFY